MPFNIRDNHLTPVLSFLVSLMILTVFIRPTQGQIEYENPEVSFGDLAAPKVGQATNWVNETEDDEYEIAITREKFFGDNSDLTVRIHRNYNDYENAQVQIERNGVHQGSIDITGYCSAAEPDSASFFDLDNNAFQDMKFVYGSCGNSGFSNIGMACYLFQYLNELHFVTFYIRDTDYSWERDIDGDGHFEILRGHHQDKEQREYWNRKHQLCGANIFRKYLFINAYRITDKGLVLSNHLSPQFPMVLMFDYETDPFNIQSDKEFMQHGQFKVPLDYDFKVIPLKKQKK